MLEVGAEFAAFLPCYLPKVHVAPSECLHCGCLDFREAFLDLTLHLAYILFKRIELLLSIIIVTNWVWLGDIESFFRMLTVLTGGTEPIGGKGLP